MNPLISLTSLALCATAFYAHIATHAPLGILLFVALVIKLAFMERSL